MPKGRATRDSRPHADLPSYLTTLGRPWEGIDQPRGQAPVASGLVVTRLTFSGAYSALGTLPLNRLRLKLDTPSSARTIGQWLDRR
jgi:hypothetical protein